MVSYVIESTIDIPYISREQMIEVDRAMREDFHVQLLQMMENAGRALARLARVRFLSNLSHRPSVTLLAGSGGNGAGALCAARHLANWGVDVSVILTRERNAYKGVPDQQLRSLEAMGISAMVATECVGEYEVSDLIIDGLIGYNLVGAPYGVTAKFIKWINKQSQPVLALDVPSGLDVDSGEPSDPTVRATATITLALPKLGFQNPASRPYVGELYLADISVPNVLYHHPPLDISVPPLFTRNDILRLA